MEDQSVQSTKQHIPRVSTCGLPPRSLLIPCKYCTALNRSSLLLVSPFHCTNKNKTIQQACIYANKFYLINLQAEIQDEDIAAIKAMLIQWNFFHSDILPHTMEMQ